LQRALAIFEQTLGLEYRDTATPLYNLALLYENLGQYEDALPLLQRALAILEKVMPHHPNTATARKSYTDLLQKM
jgi:tetratricopeptide (TPR) repeat protein